MSDVVVDFILDLLSLGIIDTIETIQIGGFSLGGQIAGDVGRELFARTNKKVDMILGKLYFKNSIR